MDPLEGVTVFVKVVETHSFTAAASALGLSKSAVSKQVRQLEDRLGARLLNRTTRQLSLTEVGAGYYARCRRIVAEAEEATLAAGELHATPRGQLRLNAPLSFGVRCLGPVLPSFMAAYPELSVDVVFNDRYVDVIEEGFDVAIRIGALRDSTLVARRLRPVRLLICAAPAYWDQAGRPAHPNELRAHHCLRYAYQVSGRDWHFAGPEGPFTVAVEGRMVVNNGDALCEAAVAGLGVAMLPDFIAGADIGRGTLESVLQEFAPPSPALYTVFPHSRHLSVKVRAFVDFMVREFGVR